MSLATARGSHLIYESRPRSAVQCINDSCIFCRSSQNLFFEQFGACIPNVMDCCGLQHKLDIHYEIITVKLCSDNVVTEDFALVYHIV